MIFMRMIVEDPMRRSLCPIARSGFPLLCTSGPFQRLGECHLTLVDHEHKQWVAIWKRRMPDNIESGQFLCR